MENHPTDPRLSYAEALSQAAGRLGPVDAAAERCGLLERHLSRLAGLNAARA